MLIVIPLVLLVLFFIAFKFGKIFVMLGIWVVSLIIPDAIPFVDETIEGLLSGTSMIGWIIRKIKG